MTLTAFLHGYPPLWSMGGEMATHRTLRAVPGSVVFTTVLEDYHLDGVSVRPATGVSVQCIKDDAESVEASALFGHSTLSDETIRAARKMHLPSILAVHAPPRFGRDLRRAWSSATVRLYNTEAARKEWRDPKGWLLHPPIGEPFEIPEGPRNARTLTSSLVNKGAARVLELAKRRHDQRFIIVESPAHPTHGDPAFWEEAEKLDNVEVWPRLHPDEMNRLWAETRVLLVPSRYETYGMAAVEAAWYGIPSVHVDTPHVREGIGTAARLIKSTSLDELDHALTEVELEHDVWSERAYDRVNSLAWREVEELERFAAGVAALTTP
jgi:Glycosyl transferases group 1